MQTTQSDPIESIVLAVEDKLRCLLCAQDQLVKGWVMHSCHLFHIAWWATVSKLSITCFFLKADKYFN